MTRLQRFLQSKIFVYGFVVPFWLGIGALMLLGAYDMSTNHLVVHVLNATGDEVTVTACHTSAVVPANGAGVLDTQCVGRPKTIVATAKGTALETIELAPILGEQTEGTLVYNVAGQRTGTIVEHTGNYMSDTQAAVARVIPGGTADRSSAFAELSGKQVVLLPQSSTLLSFGAALPSTLSKGHHVLRVE